MKILDKNGLSGYIEKMLFIILIGGLIIMITLPITLKYIILFSFGVSSVDIKSTWYTFVLIFLEISGIFAVFIIHTTLLLFRNINEDNPFSGKSCEYLKRISMLCLIEGILYLIKIIFFNSIFTIVIFMIFIILWLLALVLAELFKKAKDYKDENDLTI